MVKERVNPSLDPMDPRASYISGKDLDAEPQRAPAPASDYTIVAKIAKAERLRNSRDGNPTWRLTLRSGAVTHTLLTGADSAVGGTVTNYLDADQPVIAHVRKGRIILLTLTDGSTA